MSEVLHTETEMQFLNLQSHFNQEGTEKFNLKQSPEPSSKSSPQPLKKRKFSSAIIQKQKEYKGLNTPDFQLSQTEQTKDYSNFKVDELYQFPIISQHILTQTLRISEDIKTPKLQPNLILLQNKNELTFTTQANQSKQNQVVGHCVDFNDFVFPQDMYDIMKSLHANSPFRVGFGDVNCVIYTQIKDQKLVDSFKQQTTINSQDQICIEEERKSESFHINGSYELQNSLKQKSTNHSSQYSGSSQSINLEAIEQIKQLHRQNIGKQEDSRMLHSLSQESSFIKEQNQMYTQEESEGNIKVSVSKENFLQITSQEPSFQLNEQDLQLSSISHEGTEVEVDLQTKRSSESIQFEKSQEQNENTVINQNLFTSETDSVRESQSIIYKKKSPEKPRVFVQNLVELLAEGSYENSLQMYNSKECLNTAILNGIILQSEENMGISSDDEGLLPSQIDFLNVRSSIKASKSKLQDQKGINSNKHERSNNQSITPQIPPKNNISQYGLSTMISQTSDLFENVGSRICEYQCPIYKKFILCEVNENNQKVTDNQFTTCFISQSFVSTGFHNGVTLEFSDIENKSKAYVKQHSQIIGNQVIEEIVNNINVL